ncbi:MAG: hypothetical protein U0821_01775 [Chloroflexota bacterium]
MREAALGLLLGLVVLVAVLGAGRMVGRPYAPPWVCDDTRYVDTVSTGRAVMGAPAAAVPGCG